jgi:hypothetical protein
MALFGWLRLEWVGPIYNRAKAQKVEPKTIRAHRFPQTAARTDRLLPSRRRRWLSRPAHQKPIS